MAQPGKPDHTSGGRNIPSPNLTTEEPFRRQERRRYVLVCSLILALCLALKLPSLFFEHLEYDERIYWALAKNLLESGAYSLQGTEVLRELPPYAYDRPLFHHPPLFSIMLVPFAAADRPQAAIVVSWLGHVLAVVGVALVCWQSRRRSWQATNIGLWLPVLATALDPTMAFCGRKLWMDNLVGGLGALAMGLLCVAALRQSIRWAAASGVALGLAAMTKLTALLVVPAAALLICAGGLHGGRLRKRLLPAIAVPAAVLVLPWFASFYAEYGVLLPDWVRPDAAMIQQSGLVARAVSQPWHYYLTESVMVAPIVIVILVGYAASVRRIWSASMGVPLVWTVVPAVVLAVIGVTGQGQQLRFLTPAIPGLYVMLASLLAFAHPRRSILPVLALVAVLYGAECSGFYLLVDAPDEIVPVPEMIWRSSGGGS